MSLLLYQLQKWSVHCTVKYSEINWIPAIFTSISVGVTGKRFDFGDQRCEKDEQMVSMETETYAAVEVGKSSVTSESNSSWKGTSEWHCKFWVACGSFSHMLFSMLSFNS